jgi:hypothetical protein
MIRGGVALLSWWIRPLKFSPSKGSSRFQFTDLGCRPFASFSYIVLLHGSSLSSGRSVTSLSYVLFHWFGRLDWHRYSAALGNVGMRWNLTGIWQQLTLLTLLYMHAILPFSCDSPVLTTFPHGADDQGPRWSMENGVHPERWGWTELGMAEGLDCHEYVVAWRSL